MSDCNGDFKCAYCKGTWKTKPEILWGACREASLNDRIEELQAVVDRQQTLVKEFGEKFDLVKWGWDGDCGSGNLVYCLHYDFEDTAHHATDESLVDRIEALVAANKYSARIRIEQAERLKELEDTLKNIRSAYRNIDLNASTIDPSLLFDLTDSMYLKPADYLPRHTTKEDNDNGL